MLCVCASHYLNPSFDYSTSNDVVSHGQALLDSINTGFTSLLLLKLNTIEKITPQHYYSTSILLGKRIFPTLQGYFPAIFELIKIFYCLSRGVKNTHCSICEIFWSKDQPSCYGTQNSVSFIILKII